MGKTADLVEKNEVVTIGGFIGKTVDNNLPHTNEEVRTELQQIWEYYFIKNMKQA